MIELMIVVAIIGILAAIAIPNFLKFQARSKQGEAKAFLKSWFTAQKGYFQEHDRYSEDVYAVGAAPERGNRYAYRFGSGVLAVRGAAAVAGDEGFEVDTAFHGGAAEPPAAAFAPTFAAGAAPPATPGLGAALCPDCNIDGVASGNVDGELAGADTWYIGTADAEIVAVCATGGSAAPAGIPFMVFNDAQCD